MHVDSTPQVKGLRTGDMKATDRAVLMECLEGTAQGQEAAYAGISTQPSPLLRLQTCPCNPAWPSDLELQGWFQESLEARPDLLAGAIPRSWPGSGQRD
jgi:hypothetical protein